MFVVCVIYMMSGNNSHSKTPATAPFSSDAVTVPPSAVPPLTVKEKAELKHKIQTEIDRRNAADR